MRYALGVDLGTTYSAAAIGRDGRVEVAALGTLSSAIPSVVLLRADGEVLTGEAAERRAMAEPGRTAREFKRRLGDPAPLILGGTPYGAEALQARLLHAIVDAVAKREGEPPAVVVLTHPANYGPYKRSLLDEVVSLAEVGAVVLLSEPAAAAIDYASRDRLEPGQVVAVYDFGGGTFDAAVLRKTGDGFELLGTPEGIEHLGGIDFDQAIFAHVEASLGGRLAALDAADPDVRAAIGRLREDCRTAKETLSADTDAVIPIALPGINRQVRITRPEFEAMIRPRIGETVAALERAVRSAGLSMGDVARVLLVGGSSRIPLVAELVGAATGRPVAVDAHPKLVVALGAARFGLERLDLSGNPVAVPVPGPVPAEEPAPVPADQPAPVMAAVAAISTERPAQSTAAVTPTSAPVTRPSAHRPVASRNRGRSRTPVLIAIAVLVVAVAGTALVVGGGAGRSQSTPTPPAGAASASAAAEVSNLPSASASASSTAPAPSASLAGLAPVFVEYSVPDPCANATYWDSYAVVAFQDAPYYSTSLHLEGSHSGDIPASSAAGPSGAFRLDWRIAVSQLKDGSLLGTALGSGPVGWTITVWDTRDRRAQVKGSIKMVGTGAGCP